MDLPYQTIFDGPRMAEFWEYIKYFLFFAAPVVMIWVAIQLVKMVVTIVRNFMNKGHENDDDYYGSRRRNKNDDYDD